MITLFNPNTDTFQAIDSTIISNEMLALNILIELRVTNYILREMNRDVVTDQLDSLRADAASDTPNPVTGV